MLLLGGDAFDAAHRAYEEAKRRPPLSKRLGGIRALAATGDPRALAILAERYEKPPFPRDHERYLIARMLGDHFRKPAVAPALWKWAATQREDADAWLRFCAAGGEVGEAAEDLLASPRENPFHRAAVLMAWAAAGRDRLASIPRWLAEGLLPAKGFARGLLLEGMAALLVAQRAQLGKKPFEEAALALIDHLEAKETPERTRLVLARHFAKAFGTPTVATKAIFWKQMLAYQQVKDASGTTRAGAPRFFGIEGSGERIVFVLDLSDSMLEPLSPAERAEAVRLGLPVGEQTRNRFDLARACLRDSLEGLARTVSFAVVGFGDHAATFRSTQEMTRATRGSVAAAVRELMEFEPGKVKEGSAHGTLRGATNLHGGLRLAFQLTRKGRLAENEHTDAEAFLSGADTIFLLSDGQPTNDDFAANDAFAGGAMTKNTETGETMQDAPPGSASFYGPYRDAENLYRDVERMNLFRKVEFHCVALGDADGKLLRRLADLGLGRVYGAR